MSGGLQAIHFWHLHVYQDRIIPLGSCGERVHCLLSTFHRVDCESRRLKQGGGNLEVDINIIGKQDHFTREINSPSPKVQRMASLYRAWECSAAR